MALSLNKIKGLFIVPEDEEIIDKKSQEKKKENKTPGKKTKTSVTNLSGKNLTTTTSTQKISSGKGEFNKQIFESLTKAIADANLPGEDYLEFISALKAMETIKLDEKVKMQTVLATLSTKGLTVQKITESA